MYGFMNTTIHMDWIPTAILFISFTAIIHGYQSHRFSII
ncbi:hypothetical protein GQ607_014854 [Colletotrichum asianum]|uniref:Uncharacterized protein n=1 Tax=Colletotrichum asianum TaxID=702518 RepID=A0A8H3W262_9PEZI|nr:hypothetical protein GQ607_014854 [Colletotrichum asianum]